MQRRVLNHCNLNLSISLLLTFVAQPFELIFTNLWGPAPMVSHIGYYYYMAFVDSYTRFTWLYLIKQKSDALSTFQNFHKLIDTQFSVKIKAVQSDWAVNLDHSPTYFNPWELFTGKSAHIHTIIMAPLNASTGRLLRQDLHYLPMQVFPTSIGIMPSRPVYI